MRTRSPAWPALALSVVAVVGAGCTVVPRSDRDTGEPDGPRAPLSHRVVADDGHPLTVFEKRPGGVVRGSVLLLHGRTWSSLPDFDLQVEGEELSLMDGLVEDGWVTYALDARGYGATPRDESGWLTPDRMARDVAEILEWIHGREAGARRPALFGWSFGSTVAHLTAQREPELVSGVVLYGYWKDPDVVLDSVSLPAEPPGEPTTAEAAASDFITPGSISERAVEVYVREALAADPVRVDIAHVHQLNALDPAGLTMPVLILQGELDPIAPDSVQAGLFLGLGTGRRAWVVLGGCDHAAHLERCRPRFVRALTAFLAEVAEDAG